MHMKPLLYSICAGLLISCAAMADDWDADLVAEVKRVDHGQYVDSTQLHQWLQQAEPTWLIDVRTPAELQLVGHITDIQLNLPYAVYDYGQWNDAQDTYLRQLNPHFTQQLITFLTAQGLDAAQQPRIVVTCRSGDRSAKVVNLLNQLGYTNSWNHIDGFEGDKASSGIDQGKRVLNGWKNANLPWTYDLPKEKAYFIPTISAR